MELKTYVCPNCGANTTNAENCEYCGSLLVRFVERGIDLSRTSYLNNDAVFPCLIPELKRNLKLQEEHPNTGVCTDIFKLLSDGSWSGMGILSSKTQIAWQDGTVSDFDTSHKGFRIYVDFSPYADTSNYQEFNDKMDAELSRFMQLDSFPLFTSHCGAYVDNVGRHRYERAYAIDFGADVEGAARLISEILIKVKGFSPTETFDIFTNVGNDIKRARNEWYATHGFSAMAEETDENSKETYEAIGWLITGIIGILWGVVSCLS